MKGLAERTIVLLLIALIILGVVVTLLYLGLGPFRDSVKYNACRARIEEYCILNPNEDLPDDLRRDCSSSKFPGKPELKDCEGKRI